MDDLRVALLSDLATMPIRKNSNDAGADLFVRLDHATDWYALEPNDVHIFNTGVTVEVPRGYFLWITNKSSKDYLIGGGIVDETYQGELLVKVINPTNKTIFITHGEAIAQFLLIPCITPKIEYVDLNEIHKQKSSRGTDGGIARQLEG